MTPFNLSMELWQSPFYPKNRERDLPPLMEFKDCSMSDKESWEVSDSTRHEVEKCMYIAMRVLVCCLKGFLLHHSSTTAAAVPTFNRLNVENVEMMHQSFSDSESEEHRQDKTRQLFMGDDSLQKTQSGKGSRGDNEEGRTIGGVSSQHLFHQAFFQWGPIAWKHEVIGGCVKTSTNPFWK